MESAPEVEKIRRENPFCNNAPEIFGAMPIEEARKKFPELFLPQDEWRLPTIEDSKNPESLEH